MRRWLILGFAVLAVLLGVWAMAVVRSIAPCFQTPEPLCGVMWSSYTGLGLTTNAGGTVTHFKFPNRKGQTLDHYVPLAFFGGGLLVYWSEDDRSIWFGRGRPGTWVSLLAHLSPAENVLTIAASKRDIYVTVGDRDGRPRGVVRIDSLNKKVARLEGDLSARASGKEDDVLFLTARGVLRLKSSADAGRDIAVLQRATYWDYDAGQGLYAAIEDGSLIVRSLTSHIQWRWRPKCGLLQDVTCNPSRSEIWVCRAGPFSRIDVLAFDYQGHELGNRAAVYEPVSWPVLEATSQRISLVRRVAMYSSKGPVK